ncbi:acylglycerol kinase, mitochondrial [Zeugodacus cucurbitae]|uniref:Acylglycerol kinase, mitochondrial n=1 Tax=Zeugodacus cucurbitae TaxID=28588 RepID=A0A0A1XSV5_ZEUCU|nr:acylglycerol kinase, mitochondrial [Zeugodacus cucurbitae]
MIALKTLRNHWKKSLFAAGVAGYGLYYAKTSYDISEHMKNVCAETVALGKVCDKPKHVLVVLNPAANKRKAEKMFKEYCEPILHLSGYNVDIIKTTQEGHVKTWLNEMTVRPHAIVVAGGDGTASEVVTGLLRRKEGKCPIVLLPLGRKSATALKYLDLKPENKLERVKSLTAALTPLLQEKVKNESVMKVDFVEETSEKAETTKENSTIYGLNDFSWGLLRDIESITDKYWYFGSLRQYAATFFSAFSNKLNWNLATDYVYTPPCAGCRNCQSYENKSYVKKFLPRMYTVRDTNSANNMNAYKVNEECDKKTEGHTNVNQLNITCKQNGDSSSELETKMIDTLTPGFEFVKKINKVIGKELAPNSTIKSRTIQLQPTDKTASETHYSIDGEEYDVKPLRIEVIPNAIQVFCN